MSLIDDAAEYNVLGTERDLGRLREKWLAEFRERAVRACEDHPDGLHMLGGDFVTCAAAIRAMPLDKEPI